METKERFLISAIVLLSLTIIPGLQPGDSPSLRVVETRLPADRDAPRQTSADLSYTDPNLTPPTGSITASMPEVTAAEWWTDTQAELQQSEYQITWQDRTYLSDLAAAYQAPNRAHNLRTYFTPDGIRTIPRDPKGTPIWEWGLTLTRVGHEHAWIALSPAKLLFNGNRIEYQRDVLTEWYINDERGLEQGFTFNAPPPTALGTSSPSLTLELALSGNLIPALTNEGQSVEFTTPNGMRVLRYAEVHTIDATGRSLPTHLLIRSAPSGQSMLRIQVDTAGAIYPLTIDPLTTSPNWTVEGNQTGAWLGYTVSTAGDVNGDNYADVIVAAAHYDNGQIDEGRALVYYGSVNGLNMTPNWSAESNQADSHLSVVNTAGDVNGDGYSDVILGAPYYDNGHNDEGRAYVYYGSPTGLSENPAWTAESNADGADFGYAVSSAGDVNGDGYSDVIVGASFYWVSSRGGQAYVYYGSAAGLSTTPNWTMESDQHSKFGFAVSTAGDVNGDGYSDMIVGAPFYGNGQVEEGRVFVYHGSVTGMSTSPSWTAESDQAYASLGYIVGTAGDVNGDGYSDIVVGAHNYDNGQPNEGYVLIWYGSATGLGANGNPSNADWMAESNQTNANFGVAVSTAGDVNGDGYAEIIIGADFYDNQSQAGQVYLYYGSAAGPSATADWMIQNDQAGALFGNAVATAGDVNGDGYADVIVGAQWYENGQSDEGRAFVYYGAPEGPSSNAKTIYLPLLQYHVSRGLYGTVTENGSPVAGVFVELRFYNDASWSTRASTTTASDGTYSFLDMPGLNPGQRYYVRYLNTTNPSRLFTWHTQTLSSYTAGSQVNIGNFDVANIELVSPPSGALVPLPFTFQWTPRPGMSSDNYEFNLFDYNTGDPYFYTNPPLGYVGSYTLPGLPPGFSTDSAYVWDIWVYSPDGGYGISYWAYYVTFASAGGSVMLPHAPHTKPLSSSDPALPPIAEAPH